MRGFRYFLVVLVSVLGLALATSLVYSRAQSDSAPVSAAPSVENAPVPRSVAVSPVATESAVRDEKPSAPSPVQRARVQPVSPTGVRNVAPRTTQPRPTEPTSPAPELSPEPVVHNDPGPAPAAASPTAWQATPRQLARDSAYVMVSSGRLAAAIAVLDAWVQGNPTDTAVVLDLARLKARAGDWPGSLALYTTLVELQRSAAFLFERGQAYLWSGDAKRGEADLLASEAMEPRAETERQLGDHYRWQGDLARSASWYRLALAKAPGDTIALNSMRLLDRVVETRLLSPGELSGNDLGSSMQVISDNAGFELYGLRVSQAFTPWSNTVATVSGELRSASQVFGASTARLDGYGADIAMASRIGSGKVTASLGVLDHGDLTRIVRGSFAADWLLGNARVKASVQRAPAYETLWAPRMLGVSGSPSATLGGFGSMSLPVGPGNELSAMGELLSVSDDNSRAAFQLALRRRLPWSLSVVYAGSFMAYDRQTALYYSPARYLSHSLGLEFARYREEGLSVALRAAPGYAWMREPAGTADSSTRDLSAFQFTTGVEFGYRRGTWDLLFSTGLSNGREGGYRSRNARLFLRRAW